MLCTYNLSCMLNLLVRDHLSINSIMFISFNAIHALSASIALSLLYVSRKRMAAIESRLKALGGRAHLIVSWVPFCGFTPIFNNKDKSRAIAFSGVDLIYYDVRSAITHTNMQLWQTILGYGKGSHTAEVVVLGQRIVFTDNSENIKAILSTQFHDFGGYLRHAYSYAD